MAHILLVEDDDTIALGIERFLTKKEYHVQHADTLNKARQILDNNRIDLILLDVNLPDGSGFDFCDEVNKSRSIPLIFLTVKDQEQDIVRGLDLGGDDYITKPFTFTVLHSRISAVLRRSSRNLEADILTCGTIKVIQSETKVLKENTEIPLTKGDYNLLLYLIHNKNCTVTRNAILDKLWDTEGSFINDNSLSVAIKRLRKKLGQYHSIKTVRGIGYKMEDI